MTEQDYGPSIIAPIGKGGCGKTTVACATAYWLASKGKKTLLLDCNKQGAGIARGLSPEGNIKIPRNPKHGKTFDLGIANLVGGATFHFDFKPLCPPDDKETIIKRNPKRDVEFQKYMEQFTGPYGFIAFNQMCANLFGVFASTQQVANFITLSNYFHSALEDKVQFMVLDMKASDDFAEMYLNAVKAAHSLENMHKMGRINLELVQKALKMPDVRRFLETDYVKRDAELYAAKMRESALALIKTGFFLVCGAEAEKVEEMLKDIQPLVDRIEYQRREVMAYLKTELKVREWEKAGKKGKRPVIVHPEEVPKKLNTLGYIINNLYADIADSDENESQKRQIEKVRKAAEDKATAFFKVHHNKQLGGWDLCPNKQRKEALYNLGYKLLGKCLSS